ncbi:hypothetical protein NEFER03_2188 [Nematocida sp. LUAm3]|nr:hypothetical protein NEFER03_2188 [Nematocida sp. LUAm3]
MLLLFPLWTSYRKEEKECIKVIRVLEYLFRKRAYIGTSLLFKSRKNELITMDLQNIESFSFSAYSDRVLLDYIIGVITSKIGPLLSSSFYSSMTSGTFKEKNIPAVVNKMMISGSIQKREMICMLLKLMLFIHGYSSANKIQIRSVVQLFLPCFIEQAVLKKIKRNPQKYESLVFSWIRILEYLPKGRSTN